MFRSLLAILLVVSLPAAAGDPLDYRAERLALAATEGYNAYALAAAHYALINEHYALVNDPNATMDEINAPLKLLLEVYPLGIEVNFAVADLLDYVVRQAEPAELNLELQKIAATKRGKADAILRSILSSGDGSSPDSAFQVINTIEEYDVIRHLGLRAFSQTIIQTPDSKFYDLITVEDKNGSEQQLYFDVSLFYDASEAGRSVTGKPLHVSPPVNR